MIASFAVGVCFALPARVLGARGALDDGLVLVAGGESGDRMCRRRRWPPCRGVVVFSLQILGRMHPKWEPVIEMTHRDPKKRFDARTGRGCDRLALASLGVLVIRCEGGARRAPRAAGCPPKFSRFRSPAVARRIEWVS